MPSLRIPIVAALGLVLAVAARAEVLDASGGGFTVESTAGVPADSMTAWEGLVDEVGQWWLADHTWWGDASKLSLEPRAGGCFCEIDGARQARHMTVVFVDPGKTLRLTGGLGPLQGMGLDGVLEWRLAPDDAGGTRITLSYRVGGYTPDDLEAIAPAVDGVLGAQLQALAAHLANGTAAADAETEEIRYRCDELTVTAAFDAAGDHVTLSYSGQRRRLPHAISASGARYADDAGNELWTKGDDAMLTLAGEEPRDCTRVDPQSP